MNLPPRLERGPSWLCDAVNGIADYARAMHIATVLGGRLNESPDGQVLTIGGRGGGGGVSEVVPFELLVADGGPVKKVRVRLGTVSTPQGPWVPTGMTAGDVEPFVMEVANDGWLVLIVTVDESTGEVNSVTIGQKPVPGEGMPVAENTKTVGHLALGSFGTKGGVFSVEGAVGNQGYLHCGESHYFWGIRANE